MTNLPDLNQREILVLKNFIRILISDRIEIITFEKLIEDPNRVGLPLAFIRPTIDALVIKKFLVHVQYNNSRYFGINPEHADWFYALATNLGLIATLESTSNETLLETGSINVPAADRFVSLTDNQSEVAQAVAALSDLSEAIQNTNDPLTANPEDRLLLSKEVDLLKDLISQPRIQVVALYNAIHRNSTLKWLAEQVISGVVQQAAISSYEHLSALWQSVSNLL